MPRLSRLGRYIVCRLIDVRAEPPIGIMLVGSTLFYALLCAYGFSRM